MYLLLTHLTLAQASIVNVLSPTVGPPDPGFHGEIGLGGTAVTGNEEKAGISTAAGFQHVDDAQNHLWMMKLTGDYARAFGEVYTQKAFGHLRYRWAFHAPWIFFGFAQADHNAFRDLLVRNLLGAGLERRLWRNERSEGSIGSSIMGEYEQLTQDIDSQGLFVRSSSFVLLALQLDDQLQLGSTTFYQPRLDDFSDWRMLEECSLTASLGEHFAWTASVKWEHDSRPPEGIEESDLTTSTKISWTW